MPIQTLFDLIALIESNNAMGAMRFERNLFFAEKKHDRALIRHIQQIHSERWGTYCSIETARMIYCSSFGAAQIMGFNLYNACGLNVSVEEFLRSPEFQRVSFFRFVERYGINYSLETLRTSKNSRLEFSKKYNGSIAYCVRMESIMKSNGIAIDD